MAGGGVALLYASRELDKVVTANFDQKIGVQIIQNALKVLHSRFWTLFSSGFVWTLFTLFFKLLQDCRRGLSFASQIHCNVLIGTQDPNGYQCFVVCAQFCQYFSTFHRTVPLHHSQVIQGNSYND